MCKTIGLEDLKDLVIEESEINDKSAFRNYSKEICVLIGYLLGVNEEFLIQINDNNSIDEILAKANEKESAKAIRHLNNLRSNIMLGFKNISRSIRLNSADYKPIYKQKYLENDFNALSKLDINIITGRQDLNEYIKIINQEIMKRINDVKNIFPEWIEFKHIIHMFNMPGSIEAEREKYQNNQSFYPYKRYFYWKSPEEKGNILLTDLKLLDIIYSNDNSYFEAINKVTDASDNVKNNINNFIKNGQKIQIFIDGENTDPYRFAAAIKGLQDYEIEKIDKIIVYYDSLFSSKAWTYLQHFTLDIPVEAKEVERIKEDKSLVDHKLVAGVSKAIYNENVDSIILASSDSDFWSVIEEFDANYLVMAETDKCGKDFKTVLRQHDVFYCYLDKFIIPDNDKYFKMVYKNELCKAIETEFVLPDAKEFFEKALIQTRASVQQAEADALFEKYIEGLSLEVNKNGDFEILIPE